MNLKKKIVVTTLAASVAASAFAGIPLSTKGLAEKVGFVQVASADPFASQVLRDRVAQIVAALGSNVGAVEAAQTMLAAEFETPSPANLSKIDPIVTQINSTLNDVLITDEVELLYEIFVQLLLVPYSTDPALEDLEALRTRTDVRELLQKIAEAVEPDLDLTVDHFITFLVGNGPSLRGVEGALINLIQGMSASQLIAFVTNAEVRNDALEDALEGILDNPNYVISNLFDGLGITAAMLRGVVSDFQDDLDPDQRATLRTGLEKLGLAYLSLGGSGGGGNNGAVFTPPGQTVSEAAKAAVEALKAKKDAIAEATGQEKAALIKEAVNETVKAISTVAKLNAQSKVTTTNGKAAAKLSKSDAQNAITAIKEIKAAFVDAVPNTELPELGLTFDLGNVSSNEAQVDIDTDLVVEAIAAGLGRIELVMGEFSVAIPVGDLINKAISFNKNKSEATSEQTGGKPAASDIYTFGLTVDGQAITQFGKPVKIKLPLKNLAGLDKELLTVARIDGGTITPVGGIIEGNSIVESRDSFSSYVVIENKVSFGDTAAVQAWAGRQIEVLAAKGAIQGKAEGVFAPRDSVTRAEFAKMLISALNLEDGSATENFNDVQANDWFAPYVAAAVKHGIINGRSATQFAPKATITRAEMATMISRALQATQGLEAEANAAGALADFSDAASIHSTLQAGVAFAASKGLVIGDNGKFRPNDTANRAEAAVLIYRAFNYTE